MAQKTLKCENNQSGMLDDEQGEKINCVPWYPEASADAPLLVTWFNFNPSMDSNYIHYKVWDEITYPSLNFNGSTIKV